MKRLSLIILIVVSPAVFGLTGGGARMSQAIRTTQKKSLITLPTTRINAQTIKALSRGKKVVADLTKRGVVYEFDAGAGQIDFNRVLVRTARGEVTIGSWMETMIPKDKLRQFKYTTQSFKLGTQRTGRLSTNLPKTSSFECKPESCLCKGLEDCEDLIIGTSLCRDWLCAKDENGQYICLCFRDF